MTDLSEKLGSMTSTLVGKFDQIIVLLSAQPTYNEKLDTMSGYLSAMQSAQQNYHAKLDTIITRLETINSTLMSAEGSIEAAPIVAAIEALRGLGPENTIRSINQSVWNVAGPAPGRTLTDLYDLLLSLDNALDSGSGMTAYNLLDNLYIQLADLNNSFGAVLGDATTTLLGRMASIQYMLSYNGPDAVNLFGAVRAINDAVGGKPLDSLDLTSVRGLLYAINQLSLQTNRLLESAGGVVPPLEVCESPFVSAGIAYQALEISGIWQQATIAEWPTSNVPTGLTISIELVSGKMLHVTALDWSDWRMYVASAAPFFAVTDLTMSRYRTNEWITISQPTPLGPNMLKFFVEGAFDIEVYLCNQSIPDPNGSCNTFAPVQVAPFWRHNVAELVGYFVDMVYDHPSHIYHAGLRPGYEMMVSNGPVGDFSFATAQLNSGFTYTGSLGYTALDIWVSGPYGIAFSISGDAYYDYTICVRAIA